MQYSPRVVNPARLAQADHLPGRDSATNAGEIDVARRDEGRRLAGGRLAGMRWLAKLGLVVNPVGSIWSVVVSDARRQDKTGSHLERPET